MKGKGPIWPMPFRDSKARGLAPRGWAALIFFFVLIHFAGLGISRITGNFYADPNADHRPLMQDVLERGYPSPASSHVPPLFSYYLAFKWRAAETLGLPYWTTKYFVDLWLVVLTGILSFLAGGLLTQNRFLALTSGIFLVGSPLYALGSGMELSVILFQPVFLSSILFFVRELQRAEGPRLWAIALAGLLMGLATLIRAETQWIAAFLLVFVFWLWRGQNQIAAGIRAVGVIAPFVLAQALVLAPWSRMQRQAGYDGAIAFSGVYAAHYNGIAKHPGNRVSDWLRGHYREPERSLEGVVKFHRHWIERDFPAWLELYALKFLRTWYLSDTGRWDRAIGLLHLPLWILASLGALFWFRADPGDPSLWFAFLMILYFCGVSVASSGLARYLIPIYGFLGIFSGRALTLCAGKFFPSRLL